LGIAHREQERTRNAYADGQQDTDAPVGDDHTAPPPVARLNHYLVQGQQCVSLRGKAGGIDGQGG